jgi:acetoin utilization deacetylase AcuC-like enzyme
MSAASPLYLSHPSSLEHDPGPHPEQPARIAAIERELERRGWLGAERRPSPAADRSVLERVHPAAHIERLAELSARGGGRIDLDTAMSAGSFTAALHAAGGAVELVDRLLDGSFRTAFSAHRPPGHHAERARAMGFCLLNNVAIAAAHAVAEHGLQRVLVLDWDVHHGNGTNDIFHDSAQVLFISIHQSPLYPGTGPASDAGHGAGAGYTVNLPVPPGSGDAEFGSLVEHVAVRLGERYEPELVLVSAGYDAHREDPLAECEVTEEGYGAMTASVRGLAGRLGVPLGCVLEGGYAIDALARSVAVTLEALGAGPQQAPPPAPVSPLARAALTRLEPHWPGLGGHDLAGPPP